MPPTLHLDASKHDDIQRAAELLRQGRLVAFATETVYGLGANALDPAAVAAIFTAKQRPSWDPLIVHLAHASQLHTITHIPPELTPRIATLAAAFWPGPLTLLLPRGASIPDAVTAGRELVGVRVPAHPAAHALLASAGVPVAAPSANLFGHTSPTTADHVLADLNNRIDAVLDAGPSSFGLESTVLDPTQTPMVLYRPGAITPAQLTAATGIPVTFFAPPIGSNLPESLPSPGVGIRHYAPRAALTLTGPTAQALDAAMTEAPAGATLGVILPTDWALATTGARLIEPWASWDDIPGLAAHLYTALRSLDDRGATHIFCPIPPDTEPTAAIRDRLQKAARQA